jgi:hypothetical protein
LHGASLLSHCPSCGEWWTSVQVSYFGRAGAKFCTSCGEPAPWLSRRELIGWLAERVAEQEDDPAVRLELVGLLEKLKGTDADDARALAAWQKVRDAAPRVWEASKPVLYTLLGDALRKALGL